MDAPPPHQPSRSDPPARRWPYALAALALVAVPPLLVTYPPITDLPQQVAQVALLGEALSGAEGYRVQWATPNKLSYPLIALSWAVLPPLAAAGLAAALIAATWVAAIHWLAARRHRSVAAACLASLLAFNHVFYLGLFNFTVGLAAFAVWFLVLEGERRRTGPLWRTAAVCAGGTLLLYLAHAMWLAAGLGWLLVVTLVDRPAGRRLLAWAAGLAPVLLLVLLWYPSLGGAGWRSISDYGPSPLARLSFAGLTNTTLGGVRGWLEPLTLLAIVAWVVVALWQHRRDLGPVTDGRLLLAALAVFAAALVLPEKLDRTLRVASRWMPIGWALLLVALPPPAIRPVLRRGLALAASAGFCLATATVWVGFERNELRGLDAALAALPPAPALLGLDYVRSSPRMKQPVYMHLPAYAQLLHGGRLNFSFASLATSLVVERDPAVPDDWTQGLEWAPQLLRPTDLESFDHALLHAPPEVVAALTGQEERLVPATAAAPWRLFRIVHPGDTVTPDR